MCIVTGRRPRVCDRDRIFSGKDFLEIVWGSSFPFPYVANQVNGGLLWPALQGTENAGAIHVGACVMFWRGGVVVLLQQPLCRFCEHLVWRAWVSVRSNAGFALHRGKLWLQANAGGGGPTQGRGRKTRLARISRRAVLGATRSSSKPRTRPDASRCTK